MIENFYSWMNLILGIEFVGIVIIVIQYVPALKNKIPIGIGITIIGGAIIVKIGLFVNHFLVT